MPNFTQAESAIANFADESLLERTGLSRIVAASNIEEKLDPITSAVPH